MIGRQEHKGRTLRNTNQSFENELNFTQTMAKGRRYK